MNTKEAKRLCVAVGSCLQRHEDLLGATIKSYIADESIKAFEILEHSTGRSWASYNDAINSIEDTKIRGLYSEMVRCLSAYRRWIAHSGCQKDKLWKTTDDLKKTNWRQKIDSFRKELAY